MIDSPGFWFGGAALSIVAIFFGIPIDLSGTGVFLIIGLFMQYLKWCGRERNCKWCNSYINDKTRYSFTHCSKACETNDKRSKK